MTDYFKLLRWTWILSYVKVELVKNTPDIKAFHQEMQFWQS